MGFLGKHASNGYSPVEDEKDSQSSARESDELMNEYCHRPKPKLSRKKRICISVGGLISFFVYSVLLMAATSMYWKKERLRGANVIDSVYMFILARC